LTFVDWVGYRSLRPAGIVLLLISTFGILILLAGSYLSTLPSHAPRSSATGLAIHKSSGFPFSHSNWDFILVEEYTERRILFHTRIDGSWEDQPVRITYLDDGNYIRSVVQIEILSEAQVPWWHVEAGHAGWIGTAEGRRRLPGYAYLIGFVLFLSGFAAYKFKRSIELL
jgi:hypothetical protein